MKKIMRNLFLDLKEHLSTPEITVLIGPRQVGKTTLLLDLNQNLHNKGKKTIFFNLDIERDAVHFQSQDQLIQKIKLEIGDSEGIIFVDEIQRKENAGRFLKGLYDMKLPYKWIVSGSGSLELKEKYPESLIGRKRIFELTPVTFEEFINFNTKRKYKGRLKEFYEINKEEAKLLLGEYLNFGGYPRIITEQKNCDKLKIMDELYQSYVEKDLVYLLKVERADAFTKLIQLLASQVGSVINYSRLAAEVSLSVPTLKHYLWYAEKTFIIRLITPYFKNPRKEITKSPVSYFYDLGLRNYALGIFGNLAHPQELGFLFQNFILNIILQKIKWKGWSIHFWRTTDKAEVDFVIDKKRDKLPVEVKFTDLKQPQYQRSMRNFIDKYQPAEAWIVNLSYRNTIQYKTTLIKFIPFFDLI